MKTFLIARRELNSLFVSPFAYMIGAGFLFITGLFFYFTVAIDGKAALTRVFTIIAVMLLVVAPLLTMRLLSEEARTGTLELLLTAPVRDWEVVVGKFLAAFLFFLVMLTPTLIYLVLLSCYGQPDIPVTLSGYLGVVLLATMLLSFGVLTSAMSASPIVSAVLGVTLLIMLWLVGGLALTIEGSLGDFLGYLSIQPHFTDFLVGLVSISNIIYFLTATVAALFVATRVLEIRRWR